MRLRIASDLHNEFGQFEPADVDADLVVLAGDTDVGNRGVRWAASAFNGKPVVYILGNHEYYGRAIPKLTFELVRLGAEVGVNVMERSAIIVGGVRLLGCTLWSDFGITGDPVASMAACSEVMTDFRRIRVSPSFRRFRPLDQVGWHHQAVTWLQSALAEGEATRTIVITHHAPSSRSLSPQFVADHVSGAYASDLEGLVARSGVPLWIHGHTHRSVDYVIGRTRIVSNPRGYSDEPIEGFRPDLTIDI